tara:strand:+ start:564 stop:713 length:150 start_codon:yes stop_codon:yes gene_type:complete
MQVFESSEPRLRHLLVDDLSGWLKNGDAVMRDDGFFIGSIAMTPQGVVD